MVSLASALNQFVRYGPVSVNEIHPQHYQDTLCLHMLLSGVV